MFAVLIACVSKSAIASNSSGNCLQTSMLNIVEFFFMIQIHKTIRRVGRSVFWVKHAFSKVTCGEVLQKKSREL